MDAKTPPHQKKSKNQAHLEDGTYEQIVSHRGKLLQRKRVEGPDENQTNAVRQHATKSNPKNPSRHVTTAKSQVATTKINAVNSKERKTKVKATKTVLVRITPKTAVVKQTLTLTPKEPILVMITTQTTEITENREMSTHPLLPVAKPTTPQMNGSLEPMQ